jgi:DNA helicase-2/ATP-dependent DNA helicase PcrA
MTRAMQGLTLSHATQRRFFGEDRWQRPSCFLDEIPPETLEGGQENTAESEAEVLGEFDAEESGHNLQVGHLVRHEHFGVGTIQQLTGAGVNARATVQFTRYGTKQLLLAYAGLVKL